MRFVGKGLARPAGVVIFMIAVAAPLFVAGCGDSAADNYGESNPQVVSSKTFIVEMKGNQFLPQGISVQAGTTVTWVNHDEVAHNVRQIESEFLSPDSMSPGQSFSYTFSRAGTFRYQCTFHHPLMNGTVIVTGG